MASSKLGPIEKTGPATDRSRRIGISRVQNVLLVWLDRTFDEHSADCQNSVTQLRRVVNDINVYTDGDQCVEFIQTINDNKVCLIVSGSLGQHIVPCVHDMPQVDSIFIFCGNRTHHERWAKAWPKIRGVFTEIMSICEALKQASHQCEHNAMSISFVTSDKKLDQLDPSFMYTQIIKEILFTIKFGATHIQEFAAHCRKAFINNSSELENVKQLEQKYYERTPIWWYTYECFLYPMLNRALRLMNGDIMIRMGFFINDLHRHIEHLHKEQFSQQSARCIFTVYRGQGMTKTDVEQMQRTMGGLMSFNNFLSTSKVRDISLHFAQQAAANPDLVGILFVMTIDPAQSTTPFASVQPVSHYQSEDEVLFSMHSVFRIQNIQPISENSRLFEVNLSLTNDNDPELRALTDRIRQESFPNDEGWFRLGLVLIQMGQFDKAEEIYGSLLEQATSESDKARIYHELGLIRANQGEYREAIALCEQSLTIYQKILPPNDPGLALSYNNISLLYSNMNDYPKALSSHEKALAIQQHSLPPNHPDLGMSHNNIGLVYFNMNDYPRALSSYRKALAIWQQSLPPTHPHLAKSYSAHGNVYRSMGDHAKALLSYEKVLAIQQQSLPPSHPELGLSYYNIGLVYENMHNYSKACSFFDLAVQIGQKALPPNHPHLKEYHNRLERIKKNR